MEKIAGREISRPAIFHFLKAISKMGFESLRDKNRFYFRDSCEYFRKAVISKSDKFELKNARRLTGGHFSSCRIKKIHYLDGADGALTLMSIFSFFVPPKNPL
jgi:hypothetical protein